MTTTAASALGRDIACVSDADAFFSDATGIPVVYQDAIHRLTTDDVLGPGGDGWGWDCRRLLGMPTGKLAAMQPFLSEVLTRDPRIQTADVTLTPITVNGLADVQIKAHCVTSAGPSFDLISPVSALTSASWGTSS